MSMNSLSSFPISPKLRPIPLKKSVFQLVGSLELDWVVHHPNFVVETEAQGSATIFKVMEAIIWGREQWDFISTKAALFISLLGNAEFGIAWLEM